MDISTFNLNLLRTLDVVLEERNVSRAATRLAVTQPAVSAALAQLRLALGDPLLVRHGNSLLPTVLANNLHPRVRTVLDQIRGILAASATFDPARHERRFRVAAVDFVASTVVVPLALRVGTLWPLCSVDVVPLSAGFDEELASGSLDLAVAPQTMFRNRPNTERLYGEKVICVASATHPRLSVAPTLDELMEERFVRVSPRPNYVPDRTLAALRRRRTVGMVTPSLWDAVQAVRGSDMVAFIPERFAVDLGSKPALRVIETPFEMEAIDIAATWHARSSVDQSVDWLRTELRSFVASHINSVEG